LIGTNGDGIADEAERNVVSGNGHGGIVLEEYGPKDNVVAGNFIGTDVTGTVTIGNGYGVTTGFGSFKRIGTNGDGIADEAERNIFSGNEETGIYVFDTTDNIIAGNYIGTDITGTAALGNEFGGIIVEFDSLRNRIGTNGDGLADEAERNLISGNGYENRGFGLKIGSGAKNNIIAGSYIGTDVTGSLLLSNAWRGIIIEETTHPPEDWGPQNNRIGGIGLNEQNLIACNKGSGIMLQHTASINNQIQDNIIFANEGIRIDLALTYLATASR
jgi:parallel beta-helix repeat protein